MQGGGQGLQLSPDGLSAVRSGEAAGPLFGGTMTQLVGSLGTPFAFNPPDGSILFLEDVNERPYRIHRMLTQLRQSGILARARALVFGEMRGCGTEQSPAVHDVIRSFAADFAGPVLAGFPSGAHHGALLDASARRSRACRHQPRVSHRRGVTGFLMRIHFIGICGTAMATVAALLKRQGHDVTGSDQNVYPPMSDFLREEQIPILTPFAAGHIGADVDLVVVGNAISRGNPELETVLETRARYCSPSRGHSRSVPLDIAADRHRRHTR